MEAEQREMQKCKSVLQCKREKASLVRGFAIHTLIRCGAVQCGLRDYSCFSRTVGRARWRCKGYINIRETALEAALHCTGSH